MTFNINTFKSKMNDFGGPALSGLFVVDFYSTNSSFLDDYSARFFCKTITTPGVNFSTSEYLPNGFGKPEYVPTGITNEQINAIFMMDSQHRVISFFHEWMRNIGNYVGEDLYGANPRNSNQLAYEFAYKDSYAIDMRIRHFSTDSGNDLGGSYDTLLQGVYPTQVSGTDLSWDANAPMTLTVNFTYTKLKYSSNIPNTEFSRGNSLQEYDANTGNRYLSDQTFIDKETRFIPFSALARRT